MNTGLKRSEVHNWIACEHGKFVCKYLASRYYTKDKMRRYKRDNCHSVNARYGGAKVRVACRHIATNVREARPASADRAPV